MGPPPPRSPTVTAAQVARKADERVGGHAAARHPALANQLRLSYSSVAYVLLAALRRLGLAGTALARTQCTTI